MGYKQLTFPPSGQELSLLPREPGTASCGSQGPLSFADLTKTDYVDALAVLAAHSDPHFLHFSLTDSRVLV